MEYVHGLTGWYVCSFSKSERRSMAEILKLGLESSSENKGLSHMIYKSVT